MNRLATLRARRAIDERGFTLIELMVVVLIIAILIAIAIPTFLGARNRASDRAAQANLRNTLTAAKTSFTDNDNYSGANAAGLKAIEPSLSYQDTADVKGSKNVSVYHNAANDTFIAADYANDSQTCFYIKDVTASGTTFSKTTGNPATCTTAAGVTGTTASW
jgi:type IV pilus assembly protein PilA